MCGGPPCKDFSDLAVDRRYICRRRHTVRRNIKELNGLHDYPQVTRDDVLAAAERIAGAVERTPLIEARIRRASASGSNASACRPAASFKLRGATNRLMQLDEAERATGRGRFLVGQSRPGRGDCRQAAGHRGDHRHAGRAPAVKVEGRGPRAPRSSSTTAAPRAARRSPRASPPRSGAVVVPSFDDPHIVAGQGTVGSRSCDQLAEAGAPPPAQILVHCGGGGLGAGIALACPEAGSSSSSRKAGTTCAGRSSGEIVPVGPMRRRRCATRCRPRASRRSPSASCGPRGAGLAVSEAEVAEAVRWAWREHRLVVEPGGAARSPHSGRQGRDRAGDGGRCCQAGMSIRRFTRGWSARQRRRCDIRRARHGRG